MVKERIMVPQNEAIVARASTTWLAKNDLFKQPTNQNAKPLGVAAEPLRTGPEYPKHIQILSNRMTILAGGR